MKNDTTKRLNPFLIREVVLTWKYDFGYILMAGLNPFLIREVVLTLPCFILLC